MSIVGAGNTSNLPVVAWRNILKDSTITSGASFQAGFPVQAILTYPTWEGARPTTGSIAAWSVVFDFGAAVDFNYVAFSSVETVSTPTFSVLATNDLGSFPYNTIIATTAVDQSNMVLVSKQTFRYMVVQFANVAFVGNIMAGMATRLERTIYVGHSPSTLNRETTITGDTSESGQYLGRVVRSQQYRTALDLQNIDPEFMREELDPFFHAAREQPFYWAWRPKDYDEELIYGWMDGDPQVTNQRANGMMQASFNVRGR